MRSRIAMQRNVSDLCKAPKSCRHPRIVHDGIFSVVHENEWAIAHTPERPNRSAGQHVPDNAKKTADAPDAQRGGGVKRILTSIR